jgi:predicted nucleic acid-binding protein
MAEGILDTNILVHALMRDSVSEECRDLLRAIGIGQERAILDPLVVHEATYALQRVVRLSRSAAADYLLDVLAWPGIIADRPVLVDALGRWKATQGLGFVDAYLVARASIEGVPIYSKNIRELVAQGATVPDPLPGASTP